MSRHVSGIHRALSNSKLSIRKAKVTWKTPGCQGQQTDWAAALWPRGTIGEAELCAHFLSSPRSLAACNVNYPSRKQTSKPISLPKVTPEVRRRLGQPFSPALLAEGRRHTPDPCPHHCWQRLHNKIKHMSKNHLRDELFSSAISQLKMRQSEAFQHSWIFLFPFAFALFFFIITLIRQTGK